MSNLMENSETIQQQARLFDDVRPSGARLFLLKKGISSEKYVYVSEITSGWFSAPDKEFRELLKFSIATLNSSFGDLIAQTSFVASGTGTTLDVYKFEKKDATPPNVNSPSWKILAERMDAERFAAPEIADGGGYVIDVG